VAQRSNTHCFVRAPMPADEPPSREQSVNERGAVATQRVAQAEAGEPHKESLARGFFAAQVGGFDVGRLEKGGAGSAVHEVRNHRLTAGTLHNDQR